MKTARPGRLSAVGWSVTARRYLIDVTPDMELAQWLSGLPPDAVLRFSDDIRPVVAGVFTGYVDAYVLEACHACGLNWCWTIEGPDLALGSDDGFTIVAGYDMVLWAVRDPEFHDLLEAAVAVPWGDRLSPEEAQALDRVAALAPGRVVLSHPAWSAARIEAAIAG